MGAPRHHAIVGDGAIGAAFLEAARLAILEVHAFVSREMGGSALPYREVPGSPMGLLLSITSP